MICRIESGAPRTILNISNEQEMRKLEALKVRGVQREGKKIAKKSMFCELKSLFFFLLFFHYSFSFALER